MPIKHTGQIYSAIENVKKFVALNEFLHSFFRQNIDHLCAEIRQCSISNISKLQLRTNNNMQFCDTARKTKLMDSINYIL
jgi:hypothetical protein